MAGEMTGEERAEGEAWPDGVGADEDRDPATPACIDAIFCGCPACEANDWYAEIRRCVTWHDGPESHEEVPY